jgi:PHP family Zn ribbon phosphoesterase
MPDRNKGHCFIKLKNNPTHAKIKGITLMGTGDFTHHLWLEELKNNLEDCANGLYKYNGIYFVLTSEI